MGGSAQEERLVGIGRYISNLMHHSPRYAGVRAVGRRHHEVREGGRQVELMR